MKIICTFFLTLLSFFITGAQPVLQEVKGLPTNEVYDLHVDKKGYLWIAHDLGISRFDGLNFQHFNYPAQTSLSMTDLVEDGKGRIWCHNFTGQVFYIENGKMNLLKAYEAEKENQFPRMALCGDELLATSDRGLFVCATQDFKSRYFFTQKSSAPGYSSLAVVGSKAVLFDEGNWYLYTKGASIKKLRTDTLIRFARSNSISLQPAAAGNTFFVVSNPAGVVQMIRLKGDSLLLQATLEENDFVNAVTVSDRTWLHTRNESHTLDNQWIIKGRSLTDVVKDREGNTWFSSLKQGLLVAYKTPQWSLIQYPGLLEGDFVRCLNTADGYFFGGTNKGNLLRLDTAFINADWEQRLFDGYGSIEFIRFYKNHRFVVGTSTNAYIVNPVEKTVEDLLTLPSVKDVDFDENSLYFSTSMGCFILPYLDSMSLQQWWLTKQRQYPLSKQTATPGNAYSIAIKRTRAIRYDKETKSLLVAFKDGLNEIDEKGMHPFLAGGKKLFASSLWYKQPQLFIATFNDGLWIKNGKAVKHFTAPDFLVSNTVLRIKATKNHLWLFQPEGMQVMDIETGKLLKDIDLPKINGANVFDVAEWQGAGYLTTAEGIYKVPLAAAIPNTPLTAYLDAVIVNKKDTLTDSGISLPYDNNDLQFLFSSPAFFNPQALFFKYRLLGADKDWQTTKPGERMLRYPSLPPGTYRFEAYVFNKKGREQAEKISFNVSIKSPWWSQWWFRALLLFFVIAFIYFIYQNRLQQVLRVEKIRRNISSDLHDDIGATLSSMTIYTNLARTEKKPAQYLDFIENNAREVINKLDDLVWSINPKNDTCEQLMNRMRLHAEPLLRAAGIDPHFTYDAKLLQLKLDLFIKNNLYLLFKEMINNVVKHSGATNCYIDLQYQSYTFNLSVRDDGKGFDKTTLNQSRNGLRNMEERVRKMKGSIHIQSVDGTNIVVMLPV